jgi:L-lactate dehydrogenase complex protein LldG
MQPARDSILMALKSARKEPLMPRPATPPLNELSLEEKALIERFSSELASQTGVIYRASDIVDARRILSEIAAAECIRSVIAASDDILKSMDLKEWAISSGLELISSERLPDRDTLKDLAFSVDAGLSGAAFAVAESGTIGIAAGRDMPRLISIAPPIHIALISIDKLFPTYETAMRDYMGSTDAMPSQLVLITGPSSTADIQATPFKGMHGPGKLFVILVG